MSPRKNHSKLTYSNTTKTAPLQIYLLHTNQLTLDTNIYDKPSSKGIQKTKTGQTNPPQTNQRQKPPINAKAQLLSI